MMHLRIREGAWVVLNYPETLSAGCQSITLTRITLYRTSILRKMNPMCLLSFEHTHPFSFHLNYFLVLTVGMYPSMTWEASLSCSGLCSSHLCSSSISSHTPFALYLNLHHRFGHFVALIYSGNMEREKGGREEKREREHSRSYIKICQPEIKHEEVSPIPRT